MAYLARTGGLWKTVKNIYVRRNGEWVAVRRAFKKINGVWTQYFQGEVIAILNSTGAAPVAVNYFTAADWANPILTKRLVIPANQEIGTANITYALAISSSANGQAGSFAGDLIIDNNGIISGLSGAPNSGAGGSAVWANLPGRDGRKAIFNNYGTVRGGGGAGGIGGAGGGGVWYSGRTVTEGPLYSWLTAPETYWREPPGSYGFIFWRGTSVGSLTATGQTSISLGGWLYVRSTDQGIQQNGRNYSVYRQTTVYDVPNYTSGGAGGNGGRGQGYGVGNSVGNGGGAPGTNAGWGGTGGTGGTWGQPGNAGGAGGSGNYSGGSAGGGGGLAGAYLSLANNMTFNNFGTVQGRLLLT